MPTMNASHEILAGGQPDHVAVVTGDRTLTYAELTALVCRTGHALRRSGVGRGDRVLLLADDTPEMIATWLAALRIGAVAVALNVRSAAKDLRFVIEDSSARAALIDAEHAALWREAVAQAHHRPPVLIATEDLAALVACEPAQLPPTPMLPDEPAFWIYTSGTTGTPKAAVHRHRNVLIGHLHLSRNLDVGPGDRVFSTSKLFFAFALGHALIGTLRCGATLVLNEGWPDAAAVIAVIARQRPTILFSVPTFYRNLLRDGLAAGSGLAGIRHFVSAGEKMPEPLHAHWLATTGQPILEGIGTTETLFLAIANTPADWKPGATGRPLPWAEVELRDEADQPVTEPDVPGVLWVRMASVCAGYWNQPDRTAEAFRDGWYRTGDMFSFDAEGWWHHHGRGDDMLKISGQWVSPAEIEEAALQAGGIAEAAVVGVQNQDGLVRLALFAVPDATTEPASVLVRRIQDTVMARLSIYKCPRIIRIVDAIPRTATGKVQRFKLRQLAADAAGAAA